MLDVGLVLRAVGYRGSQLAGVPFDDSAGTVPNEATRVIRDGVVSQGEYAVGWISRGPVGLLGANRSHAQAAAEALLADAQLLPTAPATRSVDLLDLLTERGCEVVTAQGWRSVDEAEVALGDRDGRARAKIVASCSTPPAKRKPARRYSSCRRRVEGVLFTAG